MKMNKVGGDRIISVYWFAVLFLVAAGIAYMVFSFYGQPKDIRALEADALTDQVADCVSYGGKLRSNVLSNSEEFKSNFLENCNLNFEVEDEYGWPDEGQYYVEIQISEFKDNSKEVFVHNVGNTNLKSYCTLSGIGLPYCLERKFYTLDSDGKISYTVNILSVIRKTEKNAR